MRVKRVYAKRNAIWPFTVVGRPPQEDTSFGALIHDMTGNAIKYEIPGLKEIHAVDAAGVHPLLLAIGSERYTPYMPAKQPSELLTIAHHVLGTGQLSLAKFLFITADESNRLNTHHINDYLQYIFERIDFTRDLHFDTNTTIDTLDYSGTGLNSGSKLILAAYGDKLRELCTEVPAELHSLDAFYHAKLVMPGVVSIQCNPFSSYEAANTEMQKLNEQLDNADLKNVAQIIVCNDSSFVAANMNNYLWVTYTRCNPSHDVYGIRSFNNYKHWGCNGPVVFDARLKPHHAPPVEKDPATEEKIDLLFRKGSLSSLGF